LSLWRPGLYNSDMTARTEQLLAAVLELDPAERADLIEEASLSFEDPLQDPEYAAEIQRRVEDFRSGRKKGVPAEEAFAHVAKVLADYRARQ
jgi:putative addiction module component (TIGR02574 family)